MINLPENFGAKARASVAALSAVALLSTFSGAVDANDNDYKANLEPVTFVADVDETLRSYGKENSKDIAIGAKLGHAINIPAEKITERLRSSIEKTCPGIDAKVIFEKVNAPGIVFSLRYDGKTERNIAASEMGTKMTDAAQHVCTTNKLDVSLN